MRQRQPDPPDGATASDAADATPTVSAPQAAHYIASVTRELQKLAHGRDMELVVWFLELARLEAEAASRAADHRE